MKISIIRIKKVLPIFIFLLTIIILLSFSKTYLNSIKSTTNIFIQSVFPALFPFLLLSEIAIHTKIFENISKLFEKPLSKIYNISKHSITPIILGFLCGFPSGTRATAKLYEQKLISKREATILITLTNNFNPAFILSTIGIIVYSSIQIGIILFISHYTATILLSYIFSKIYRNDIIHEKRKNLNTMYKNSDILDVKCINNTNNQKTIKELRHLKDSNILKKVITSPFISLSVVFGFMIIFNILYDFLKPLFNLLHLNIYSSIFEITRGSAELLNYTYSLENIVILQSFLLGFAGLSILLQIYVTLGDLEISFKFISLIKFMHGLISGIITYTILKIFPNILNTSISVFKNIDKSISKEDFRKSISLSYAYSIGIIILFLIIAYIFNILKNKKAAKLLATYKEGG